MAQLVSEAVFRIAYDGEAVRDGEMEVADLAPALLGLAQMLKSAGRVVEGDDSDISVRVRSTRDACFEVDLSVVVHGAKAVWEFWKSDDVQAAATLLGLLGFTGFGALGFVRQLGGRRPTRITPSKPGYVAVEIDGEVIEVPDMVARIGLDPGVRAGMEKAIAEPLEREGIESVSFGPGASIEPIAAAESSFFKMPIDADEDEFISRHTKAFSIVTLSFKSGQKWRLHDGRSKPLVTMGDKDFQARVDGGIESFANGDILICEVVETSRRTATGFKSEYEITRVVEHRKVRPVEGLDFGGPIDEGPKAA